MNNKKGLNNKMLNKSRSAVLHYDIEYNKKGIRIQVSKGTIIQVDALRDIALIDLDHVHIDANEYSFIQHHD